MNRRAKFFIGLVLTSLTMVVFRVAELSARQVDFIAYEDEREKSAAESGNAAETLAASSEMQRMTRGDLSISPAGAPPEDEFLISPLVPGHPPWNLTVDEFDALSKVYRLAGATIDVIEDTLPAIGLGETMVRELGKVWMEYYEMDASLREVLQEMKKRQEIEPPIVLRDGHSGDLPSTGVPLLAEGEADVFGGDRARREGDEEFPMFGLFIVALFFLVMLVGVIAKAA